MRTLAFSSWAILLGSLALTANAAPIDFEDVNLPNGSFYNGSDNAGGFTSGTADFNNLYTDFGGGFTGWTGWSASNVVDNTTAGFGNQYAAYPGSGGNGSSKYGVLFASPFDEASIEFTSGEQLESMQIANSTYAALSMKNGDSFAKKFGGVTGNDPDYFGWTITGTDASSNVVGSITVYLADFRFADNSLDYIVSNWITVDLTSLQNAVRLDFTAFSSDTSQFGTEVYINTPTYLVADNITFVAVPEVSTLWLGAMGLMGAVVIARKNTRTARSSFHSIDG